jgi:hypothetical protein
MAKSVKKWDDDPEFALWKQNNLKNVKRCFESHPALKIGDYQIEGGSCAYPVAKDADVYIGFDWTMKLTPPQYPWEDPKPMKHTEVYFPIPDGGIPPKPADFVKLVEWTAAQLIAGRKVHTGCIGGHGRTGMFLAALVMYMTGDKNAIQYVRDAYCKKAVETKGQVAFLVKYFGVNTAEGSKEGVKMVHKGYSGTVEGLPFVGGTSSTSSVFNGVKTSSSKQTITPVNSKKNIWRDNA